MTFAPKFYYLLLFIIGVFGLTLVQGARHSMRGAALSEKRETFVAFQPLQVPEITATPTPTSAILTPIAATPTITIIPPQKSATPIPLPTITPTATPTATFVPTTTFQPKLYLPLLLNQGDPVLRNGDFEAGSVDWSEYSSGNYRLIVKEAELQNMLPHSGEWAAWLGGKNNETSELSQQMKVAASTSTLHFWYNITAQPQCGLDIASVLIDEDLIEQFHLCKITTSSWTLRILDLSRYQGQIVTLRFRVETDRDGRHSNFFIDDVDWSAAPDASIINVD